MVRSERVIVSLSLVDPMDTMSGSELLSQLLSVEGVISEEILVSHEETTFISSVRGNLRRD